MNSIRGLLKIFRKPKQFVQSSRSFHKTLALYGRTLSQAHTYYENLSNALFFTNLPKTKKEKRRKKIKIPNQPLPSGNLVIECKNSELNHYSGMNYGRFDTIPLASKGWHHRKSKGDYFTILPPIWHPAFVTKEDLPDTFEENGISEKVIQQLKKINITHPTVIQAKICKNFLKGHNVFFSAECGSGKTVGYITALIENVLKWKQHISGTFNAPIGIVLLPTRELAIQVGILASNLGSDLGIRCQTLIGGNIKDLLLKPEMVPVDILTCTSQVLLKHIKSNLYTTLFCRHVIIDEADTFIDESFIGQIRSFINHSNLNFTGFANEKITNQSAQICFVSAAVPKDMETVLFDLIKGNNMKIEATTYLHKAISYAQQVFKRVSKSNKPQELLKIIKSNMKNKIPTMIFSNRLNTATWVSLFLNENNIQCGKINGDIHADDRLMHYRNFEGGIINVISCTDLASRGLNFSRVKHVINFEFPTFMIDYIHRCGRTGRLGQGNNCKITSFISSGHELVLLKKIELAVRTNTPLPSIYQNRILNNFQKY